MKKATLFLSVLLTAAMLLGVITCAPYASGAEIGAIEGTTGDCTWRLDENGTLTISGNGAMEDYSETSKPWGTGIKQLFISNGVTSIGKYAFYSCTNLTRVSLPDSVERINTRAFSRCSNLEEIDIPNSVIRMDREVFDSTKWYKNQPEGMIYIGKIAYEYKGTPPETVTIKQGTLGIAGEAFKSCSALKGVTLPEGLISIGDYAFDSCKKLESLTLPDSLREMGFGVFSMCYSITSMTIPSGVKNIDDSAFTHAGLRTISLPATLQRIGNQAFESCTHLTEIRIPLSVNEIGRRAFYQCSNITEIRIPYGVKEIKFSAFRYCSKLSTISIPDSVNHIEHVAFGGTEWYKNQPDGFVYAGKVLYKNKGDLYDDVTISDDINGIAAYAFEESTKLKTVKIPDNITELLDGVFINCTFLKIVTLPKKLETIGNDAFNGCSSLETLDIPETLTAIGNNAFMNTRLSKLTLPDGVNEMGTCAFQNCTLLKEFNLPASLTSIQTSLFSGCRQLKTVVIPYGVNSISSEAFMDCGSLSGINIPSSVTYIGSDAFSNCNSLYDITIPPSVTTVSSYAFGYTYNSTKRTHTLRGGISITGAKSSAAHTYAKNNKITFKSVKDNRILWGNFINGVWTGMDNLRFINSYDSFVRSEEENKYVISQENLDRLRKNLHPTVKQDIENYANNGWGGSCYGMSVVVSLIKAGYLNPSFYTENATTAHGLKRPVESNSVMNLINFYHLSQFLPDVSEQLFSNDTQTNLLQKLVEETDKVKTGGLPAVVCFSWKGIDRNYYPTSTIEEKKAALKPNESTFTDLKGNTICFTEEQVDSMTIINGKTYITTDGKLQQISFSTDGSSIEIIEEGKPDKYWFRYGGCAHAVVAYDVDVFNSDSNTNKAENGTHYKYRVHICDPNNPQWSYLWVSEDFTDWYYHYMALNTNTNVNEVVKNNEGKDEKKILGVVTDNKVLNIRNLENDTDYVSDKNKFIPAVFIYNPATFTLSTESGKTYTVASDSMFDNGGLIKTYVPTSSSNGVFSKATVRYMLPEGVSQNQAITLKPLKDSNKLDVKLTYNNYTFSAASDHAKSITTNPKDGSVSLKSGKDDFTLATTFNSGCDLPWYTVKVSGKNATEASLKVESDGVVLHSDSLKSVKATANNDKEAVSVSFNTDKDTVKLKSKGDNTLAAYVDNDNNGTFETELPSGNEQSTVSVGDVNGDGKVNGADAGLLSRYTSGWKGYESKIKNMDAADINGDGKVNGADSGILARYTSGWKQYAKYFA